jgi:hypothetical protein
MDTSQIYTVGPSNQSMAGLGEQDTITLSSVTAPVYTTDTIDLARIGTSNTVLGSPHTVTSTLSPNTVVGGGFTMGATYTPPWFTQSNTTPRINLDGENADIVVNGHSLVEAINSIRDRLNCLQINPELEAEWDQLKDLGDQYRELERQILAKQATWDRLKAMPRVDIE